MQFCIEEINQNQRLDLFLSEKTELSRSLIKKLIESSDITVNSNSSKPSYKLRLGDKIVVVIPKPKKMKLGAEDIPLNIIYEDSDIIVINKQRRLTVHPGAGNHSGTLVNALLHHCKDLSGIGGVERPGIVHRLDKDTSGVLIVAKNDRAHQNLSKQFKNRKVEKVYLAIVSGLVKKDNGTIDEAIGRHPVNRKKMSTLIPSPSPKRRRELKSRDATTNFKVLKRFDDCTLVELKPKTGRTHQLRVHMKHIGHPILNDPVYGSRVKGQGSRGQLLHAYKIKFKHPISGKSLEFQAEIPQDMLELI